MKADNVVEARVEELLSQLTLQEKVSLLSGIDNWRTAAIDRLGIPSITMTDGPHGVRANNPEIGRKSGPATAFPTGSAMAATWNPGLIERAAQAMAEETLAMDCDILLGPCVNIIRTPLAGRNFETYAEDPYLAGQIGKGWVKGLQSRGVGASLKHYACNNQEIERFRGSSEIDERTLREIYLAQFEMVVKEAQPWTVMCSYNRINGVYASQHRHLLTEILRDEWGFEGIVVSDWGANHTITESVEGGLDLEMPGPPKYYGRLLMEAVNNWQIEEATVDEAARRILRMIVRSGRMEGPRPAGSINTPEHQALAAEVAEEAITLLKNDGNVLPLDPARIQTLAIIGPNAAEIQISGGGSSYLEPPYRVSPFEGLRKLAGHRVELRHEAGCDNWVEPPTLKAQHVVPAADGGSGLRAEFFASTDCSGAPVLTRQADKLDFWWFVQGPAPELKTRFSARFTAAIKPLASGTHILKVENSGSARLYLDDNLVLDSNAKPITGFHGFAAQQAEVTLEAGRSYDLKLEFTRLPDTDFAHVKLMFGRVTGAEGIEAAAKLAAECDAALVFVGMPEGLESEGHDFREGLGLPGMQDALVAAVARANPKTAVIVNAGSPVAMPWLAEVPAAIFMYYPGLEGGSAIARVITGAVNPSGKLTSTFPVRLEDSPASINLSLVGARTVHYGEGVFVGYRYFDTKGVRPLLPFGHGLSYTQFAYEGLQVPSTAKAGDTVRVSVTVRNTGSRAGKEIVQLYVADLQSSVQRPVKELKGFAKVSLEPGASKTVSFSLDRRTFAFYDAVRCQWTVEPGEFEILAGSSSADIRAHARITLE